MREKISKYFFISLIIVLIIMLSVLIYIRFFKNNSNSSEYAELKEKGQDEVLYLDYVIINSLNKLNNISYSRYEILIEEVEENSSQSSSQSGEGEPSQGQDGQNQEQGSTESNGTENATDQSENKTSRLSQTDSLLNANYNDIPWKEISYSIETLYTAWPTISIDFQKLNVNNEDLSNFEVTLDGAAQSIKNSDKSNALINLYNLYTFLPKFLSYFVNDNAKLNLYNTKAYLLNAYISVDKSDWENMSNNVNSAINSLQSVINSGSVNDYQKSTFDKALALLQDIKSGISIEDKEIFFLKYKLAIEQLEVLKI